MAEEEGQDQGLNVAAIHIRVTHDDNLVIAKLGHVQGPFVLLCSEGDAQRRVDVLDLLVLENLVVHGLFHVEDFTSKRHDRLVVAVSALLGGSTCRITLHQEELTQSRVLLGTIGQLSGQARAAHHGLALDHFTRFSSSVTGLGSEDDFVDDGLGFPWVFFEVSLQHIRNGLAHRRRNFRVAELGFGLALELRFRHLDADDGGQSFTEVIGADVKLEFVQHPARFRVLLQCQRQSTAETGEVRTALVGIDVVDVGEEVLRKRRVVRHSHFHWYSVALPAYVNDFGNEGLAVRVEVAHEILEAFRRVEGLAQEPEVVAFLVLHPLAEVGQGDGQPLVEEGQLAHAIRQRVVGVDEGLEDLLIGLEFDRRAVLV